MADIFADLGAPPKRDIFADLGVPEGWKPTRRVVPTAPDTSGTTQRIVSGIGKGSVRSLIRLTSVMPYDVIAGVSGALDAASRGYEEAMPFGMGGKSGGAFGSIRDWALENARWIEENSVQAEILQPRQAIRGKQLWGNWELLTDAEWLSGNITEAVVSMLPQVGLAVSSGGSTLSGAFLGSLQEAAPFYRELIDDGVDPDIANAAAQMFGLGVGVLNNIGLEAILGKESTNKAVAFLIRKIKNLPKPVRVSAAAGTEATTEYLEEPLSALIEGIAKKKKPSEIAIDVAESFKKVDVIPGSLFAGGAVSVFTTSPTKRIKNRLKKRGATKDQIAAVTENMSEIEIDAWLKEDTERRDGIYEIAIRKVRAGVELTALEEAVISERDSEYSEGMNKTRERPIVESADTEQANRRTVVDDIDFTKLERTIEGKQAKVSERYIAAEEELARRIEQKATAEERLEAETELLAALEEEATWLQERTTKASVATSGLIDQKMKVGEQNVDTETAYNEAMTEVASRYYHLDSAEDLKAYQANLESALDEARVRVFDLQDQVADARGEPTVKTRQQELKATVRAFADGVRAGKQNTTEAIKTYQQRMRQLIQRSGLPKADQSRFLSAIEKVKNAESLARVSQGFIKKAEKLFVKNEIGRLQTKLKSVLKKMRKPAISGDMPVSQFDSTTTAEVQEIVRVAKINKTEAQGILATIDAEQEAKTIFDRVKIGILEVKALGSDVSPELLSVVINDLNEISRAGRQAKSDADFRRLVEKTEAIDEVVDAIRANPEGKVGDIAINIFSRITSNIGSKISNMVGAKFKEKFKLWIHENNRDIAINTVLTKVSEEAKLIYGVANLPSIFADLNRKVHTMFGLNGEYELSRFEMMHIFNSIKNEATRLRYEYEFGAYQLKLMVDKLKENSADIEFADYLQEQIQDYWDVLNERHIEKYGRQLGLRQNYWPQISRRVGDFWDRTRRGSADPSAMKKRSDLILPPCMGSAWDVFARHVAEAEHVRHLTRPYESVRRVFASPQVQSALTKRYGPKAYAALIKDIDELSINSVEQRIGPIQKVFSFLLNNWVVTKVASPMVALSQFASAGLYMINMPVGKWHVGFFSGLKNAKQTFKFMVEGASGYFEERYNMGNTEALARSLAGAEKLGSLINSAARFSSFLSRSSDAIAQIYGGYPYVLHRMDVIKSENPTMTDAEIKKQAFNDFRELSAETQQARQKSALSEAQRSRDVGSRALFAFANTVNQFVRLQGDAVIAYRRKQITGKQFAKIQIAVGIIMPIMYVWLREAWKLPFRIMRGDDPEEELIKKADDTVAQILTQPLGFLPPLQSAGIYAYRKARGLPRYRALSLPMIDEFRDALELAGKKEPGLKDILFAMTIFQEMVIPLPTSQIWRIYKETQPRKKKEKVKW